MTTVALVHGGWHDLHCWDLLVPLLRHRHATVAMDLPSTDPTAGAAEYARVVLGALPPDDDVILVGHSLAGLTVPLVAAALQGAARPVSKLVLVAAMLPEPGRSVDERARAGERQTRRGLGRGQTADQDGSTRWLPDAAVEWLYPDAPPEVARAAAARLRPQHWKITAEPSPLIAWPDVPTTSVLCTEDRVIDADWARAHAPGELVELPGDHSPFLARPGELAAVILG